MNAPAQILIADDNPANLDIFQPRLTQHGYEILTALVQRANPTATDDPTSDDQKLVWVMAPDPANPDQSVILITTRKAAGANSYKLPAVFLPAETE